MLSCRMVHASAVYLGKIKNMTRKKSLLSKKACCCLIGSLLLLSSCNKKPPQPLQSAPGEGKEENDGEAPTEEEVQRLFGDGKLDKALTGGYTIFSDEQLKCINKKLAALSEVEKDKLRGKLHIGVQQGTQVTSKDWAKQQLDATDHLIHQVYVSGCSVDYSRNDKALWQPLASLVLEAAYEDTLRWA